MDFITSDFTTCANFLNWLGLGATMTGYSIKDGAKYVSRKFKSEDSDVDYKDFTSGLRKSVKIACDAYRKSETCGNIQFPKEYDGLIYKAVLQAINEDKPFSIDMLLPHLSDEDFCAIERNSLYQILLAALRRSFEYAMRDFSAWVKLSETELRQEVTDIRLSLDIIIENTAKIQKLLQKMDTSWRAQQITYEWICEQKKEALENEADYKKAYYGVSDKPDVLSHVICAGFDVPNDKAIKQAERILQSTAGHFFIVGNGGEGKTSLLFRLAVQNAKIGKPSFWLRLDESGKNIDVENARCLLDNIHEQACAGKSVACLFIDNMYKGQTMLKMLHEAWEIKYDKTIRVIGAERIEYMNFLCSANNSVIRDWLFTSKFLCLLPAAEVIKSAVANKEYTVEPICLAWKEKVAGNIVCLQPDIDEKELKYAISQVSYKVGSQDIALADFMFRIIMQYNKNLGREAGLNKNIDLHWDVWEKLFQEVFGKKTHSFRWIAAMSRIGQKVSVRQLAGFYDIKEHLLCDFLKANMDIVNAPVRIYREDDGWSISARHDIVPDLYFEFQKREVAFEETVNEWIAWMGDDAAKADAYFAAGEWYLGNVNYAKALEFFNLAIDIRENVLGKEHPDTATAYHNIALVYYDQGNYAKAFEFYNLARAIREKVLGKEHPDTAATYSKIALVYRARGNSAKAFDFFNLAREIYEKVLGKEHPDTATAYRNVARVYHDQDYYAKALEFYNLAMATYEKVLGKEHHDIATGYHNIARVHYDQGDYAKAFEFFNLAKAIYEKVLGKKHPATARTYQNIALVYHEQGDYAKAFDFYELAREIYEKVLGKEHPYTAMAYQHVAFLYHDRGDYDEAFRLCKLAIAIREKVLGKEHHATAISYHNIAFLYHDQGDYAKAFEFFNLAREIYEKVLGKEHPDTAMAYYHVAFLYHDQGDYDKALQWYVKAFVVFHHKYETGHLTKEKIFHDMRSAYAEAGKKEDFASWLEKQLENR